MLSQLSLLNPNESTSPKSVSIRAPRNLLQAFPTIRPLINDGTPIPNQPTNNKELILFPKESHAAQLVQTGVNLSD